MRRILTGFLVCLVAVNVSAEDKNAAGNNSGENRLLKQTDANNVIVREVVGEGPSRSEAIKDGLFRAVEQSKGVRVGSGTYRYGFRGAGADIDSSEAGRTRIEFDAINVATSGTTETTAIAGLVKEYDVLEETKDEEGNYRIKLKVSVYDYGQGRSSRVKLALMPIRTTKESYQFLDMAISGKELSGLLGRQLGRGLVGSNKFSVLDREQIGEFLGEGRVLQLLDAPPAELAKLSASWGADYFLIAEVTDAKIYRLEKRLQVADYTASRYKGRSSFDYRVVDSLTKQVVAASTVEKNLDDDDIRKLAQEPDPDEWDTAQVRDAFLSLVADEVVEKIIDKVYPIRIAAVQNGRLILNQGGERMSEGMLLEVYAEGKEIFDVDTGESLGKLEEKVATIKVESVSYNISFAKVTEGEIGDVSVGFICRMKEAERKSTAGRKRDVEIRKGGGVKLPFDR